MVTTHRPDSLGASLRRVAVGAVAVVALALPGTAAAAPGDLDPSFGPSQPVITDFGADEIGAPVVVQPDGKALALFGQVIEGVLTTSVARFDVDGSLDADFGLDGVTAIQMAGGGATGIALHGDGFVVSIGATLVSSTRLRAWCGSTRPARWTRTSGARAWRPWTRSPGRTRLRWA